MSGRSFIMTGPRQATRLGVENTLTECVYSSIGQAIGNANVFAKYSAKHELSGTQWPQVVSVWRRLAQYCGRFWFSANRGACPLSRVRATLGRNSNILGPEFHGLGGWLQGPRSSVSFGVFGLGLEIVRSSPSSAWHFTSVEEVFIILVIKLSCRLLKIKAIDAKLGVFSNLSLKLHRFEKGYVEYSSYSSVLQTNFRNFKSFWYGRFVFRMPFVLDQLYHYPLWDADLRGILERIWMVGGWMSCHHLRVVTLNLTIIKMRSCLSVCLPVTQSGNNYWTDFKYSISKDRQ